MSEQLTKRRGDSRKDSDTEDVDTQVTTEEASERREVILADIDELLDTIDEVLDAEEQQEIDEILARAAYKEKLKSIAFMGRRAVDPCLEPGLIRVPEYLAERLLSAGLAREHDCNDCD